MLPFFRPALSAVAFALWAVLSTAALAQADAPDSPPDDGKRLTLNSLHPGATLEQMPDWLAFRSYACGSNGGPPLRKLTGWADFKLCKPDENGLYEVYFEYDNEAEYILRALDNPSVTRFVGTTEQGFPIVASALFSEDGVLRGVRMVTDPRADYTSDQFFELTDLRTRADFYLLGPFVGGQVGINPARDCTPSPLAEGESKIGNTFVKLDCERIQDGLRYILRTRYYRKPGQFARDPRSGQITEGQYESSTVFEEYQVGYGPASVTPGAGGAAAPAADASKG
jgi:hypothetical protein